jgi:rhodanese-related sulfurtransferase
LNMKTFSVIGIIILVCCSSIAGQVPDSLKFKSLLPKDFYLTFQKEDKAILIDVREFFEFRKVRLKDAINIPSSGNLGNAADTLNKESALFLYCTSGFRSKKAAKFFYDKGFPRLWSLEGGIVEWKKEGMPVDRKRVKRK